MTIGGSNGLDALPARGSEPAVLLVGAGYDHDVLPDTGYGAPYEYFSPLPSVFLLAAPLQEGTYAFFDLWDGVSGIDPGGAMAGTTHRVGPAAGRSSSAPASARRTT